MTPTDYHHQQQQYRQAHSFYPQYPTPTQAGMPPSDGMGHVNIHAPVSHNQSISTAAPTITTPTPGSKRLHHERDSPPSVLTNTAADDDGIETSATAAASTTALFGSVPEAKRRKFILVDDAQRGARVRVRVMLDQVRMAEMPDSYRKHNSVYPRSWFATEMQSPPPPIVSGSGSGVMTAGRKGDRWADDWDEEAEGGDGGGAEEEGEGAEMVERKRTWVPVGLMDGSEAKLAVPRMTRQRRAREVLLNDLGYRMSWSQSRVFSGRTLFLQRSLDAYRNKMRSTMVAAGQDVAVVAPHFETRIGKRKWLEREKRLKRESTP